MAAPSSRTDSGRQARGGEPDPADPTTVPPATGPGRRWRSDDLFGAEQEIEIQHGQAIYRLRRTALGKLILTK